MDAVDLRKFMDRTKSLEARVKHNGRAVHPSDFVKSLKGVENDAVFQAFATALLEKLDEITDVVKQQSETLNSHGEKLDHQSRQIAKMNEAFDMIMGDYFKEVTDGVEDFNSFLNQFVVDHDKEHLLANNTEGESRREALLTRLELLKGRADLVEETTVSFSSENMQEIYRAIIPGIKSEIDALYGKIVKELHAMHEAGSNNIVNNTDIVLRSIKSHNDNLNHQTRNLIDRISSSEKATKMAMPGNERNNYRN